MHRAHLLSILQAIPFRPFKLVMVDGNAFPVSHEDFIHVLRNGTIIYDDSGEKPWRMLNANLVARIDFFEEPAGC